MFYNIQSEQLDGHTMFLTLVFSETRLEENHKLLERGVRPFVELATSASSLSSYPFSSGHFQENSHVKAPNSNTLRTLRCLNKPPVDLWVREACLLWESCGVFAQSDSGLLGVAFPHGFGEKEHSQSTQSTGAQMVHPYRDPVVPNLRRYDWSLQTYSVSKHVLRRYLHP